MIFAEHSSVFSGLQDFEDKAKIEAMCMRRFHSYGPVDCEEHFCVPRTELVQDCLEQLIGHPDKGGHYFTIWAPRQTGKTWLMRQVQTRLTREYEDRFL